MNPRAESGASMLDAAQEPRRSGSTAVKGSLPVLLLLLTTFFLYARTLSYQFVYDDNYQIRNNEHVLAWRYLPVYFTQNFWSHIPNNQSNLYRPFFLIWLRTNMAVFGTEPWGWHLTTVLVNVLITGLVYLVALRILNHRLTALVAAALFAVHPIHVEAVAWVSGVAESLGAGFLLLSFLFYLQQRDDSSLVSSRLVLSLLCFSAAVLTKETEVVLPLLIVLYEYTLGSSSRRPRWGIRLVPYFLILGGYFVLRHVAMHGVLNPGEATFHEAVLSLPWLFCVYLKMLFWPVGLSPLYDFAYVDHVTTTRFVLGLALIIACCGLTWWSRKRWAGGIFCAGWFALTLAPAVGAFFLAFKSESYHDRYLYLPSFALAIGIAWLFRRLNLQAKSLKQAVAWGGVALLFAAMAAVTYRQQRYWESNYALFERAAQIAPQNERGVGNYIHELIDQGNFSRALSLSERMIKLHPESVLTVRNAASAAFLLHDFSLAERYYSRGIELDPSASLYFRLGVCRINLGRYEAALEPLGMALSLAPGALRIHDTRGFAFLKLGRWSEARNEFASELEANPADSVAQHSLAEAEAHLQPKPQEKRKTRPPSLPPAS